MTFFCVARVPTTPTNHTATMEPAPEQKLYSSPPPERVPRVNRNKSWASRGLSLSRKNLTTMSEENLFPPISGESFWEIGQYRRTVKRIDQGSKLCDDLMAMVKERGEVEAAYAKHLRGWSKKWHEHLQKGPEYGSMAAAWSGVLAEAERNSDLHLRIKDRLIEEVFSTVKMWQKENFHTKALSTGIKEAREAEDDFKKAQKAWMKACAKLEKAKKEYHQSCDIEKRAIIQDKNAQEDGTISRDQQRKITEKAERCGEEKERMKDLYLKSLENLNSLKPQYIEDMSQVFEKCQELEGKRLKFFKEMFLGVHKCVDLSNESRFSQIYTDYAAQVSAADFAQDLKWWKATYGTGMAMHWPVFEDFTAGMRPIGKKMAHLPDRGPENAAQVNGGPVTLIHKRCTDETDTSQPTPQPKSTTTQNQNSSQPTPHPQVPPPVPTSAPKALSGTVQAVPNGVHKGAPAVPQSAVPVAQVIPQSAAPKPPPYPTNGTTNNGVNVSKNGVHSQNGVNVPQNGVHQVQNGVAQPQNGISRPDNIVPDFQQTGVVLTQNEMHVPQNDVHAPSQNGVHVPETNGKHVPMINGTNGTISNGHTEDPITENEAPAPVDPTSPTFAKFPDVREMSAEYIGVTGIPVTALYDYKAQEDDELSFIKGDVIEKLEDEDEQGWCTGRMKGRVGLFPANYAAAS